MNILNTLSKEITFKDPIHGSIKVNKSIIIELIDSKEFQRLRRIRQLGFTYTVFHTATHDRFSHSLGVYELARRLVWENKKFSHMSDYDKVCVCIAALLHDVGHGPYSHTFETVFPFNHEEMSCNLINSELTEINNVLRKYDENLPKIISDIINKDTENKLLSNIISSDLDVDRMDYLIRDSYFSSTSLGVYDHFQLIRNMEIIDDEIVINEKAINSLESFFIARHHMFRQVYTHIVSESFEVQGIWFFERLNKLHQQGYNFSFNYDWLIPFLENSFSINDFLAIDDYDIQTLWKKAATDKDVILSTCANNLLNRKKCGIKRGNVEDLESTFKELRTISSRTETLNKSFTKIKIKVRKNNGEVVVATSISPILKGLVEDIGRNDDLVIYYI